jgi:putative DNA primase/helicase
MKAETIAIALGGRKVGAAWMAVCPAHEDRKPSLAITYAKDGTVLVRCHAGCDQRDVIEALRARGLWQSQHTSGPRRKAGRIAPVEADPDIFQRAQAALAIWHASKAAHGTPVAIYLRSRGLCVSLPPSIRFHDGLKHPSGGVWPAMVALVTRGVEGTPTGIHRTFLARAGGGKAPVAPAKMMLGPCRGGAVRLGQPEDVLMIGEGIETCLAAVQATGHAAWAALSPRGLRSRPRAYAASTCRPSCLT